MGQLATQLLLECIGDIRKIRQVNLDAELIRGV
jgi:hypothetical protein